MENVTPPTTTHTSSKAQLSWNDNMKVLLLTIVQSNGGHLLGKKKKGKQEIWSKIFVEFFSQDEMAPYKDDHLVVDAKGKLTMKQGCHFRKLEDKYKTIMQATSDMMLSGNTSALPGGTRSDVFKRAEQIQSEILEVDEEKKALEETQAEIDDNEEEVLKGGKKKKPVRGWGVRKDANGQLHGTNYSIADLREEEEGGEEGSTNLLKIIHY
jgi:hypothetical protein